MVRRYAIGSWAETSVVQDRVSAVKDNSMKAGIEEDLDRGVSARISTTKLYQKNVGKECKVKNASQNSVALAVKRIEKLKWKCRESSCDGLGSISLIIFWDFSML